MKERELVQRYASQPVTEKTLERISEIQKGRKEEMKKETNERKKKLIRRAKYLGTRLVAHTQYFK